MQDAFHIALSVCYFQIGCHVSKFPCHGKQGREGHSNSPQTQAILGHCHLPLWHWGGSECASGSRNLPAPRYILLRGSNKMAVFPAGSALAAGTQAVIRISWWAQYVKYVLVQSAFQFLLWNSIPNSVWKYFALFIRLLDHLSTKKQ